MTSENRNCARVSGDVRTIASNGHAKPNTDRATYFSSWIESC